MTVHRIDDRDLRCALGRMLAISADELLEEIRKARLDREIEETQRETDAAVAALDTPSRDYREMVRRHDAVTNLFARTARLMRERYPESKP